MDIITFWEHVPSKNLSMVKQTPTPVIKSTGTSKLPTGKAKVDILVQSGIPLELARTIVYKRQYAYAKRTNYAAQRKYDSKSRPIQDWHL